MLQHFVLDETDFWQRASAARRLTDEECVQVGVDPPTPPGGAEKKRAEDRQNPIRGGAEGGEGRGSVGEWRGTMRRVRKNKAAFLQHMVLLAQVGGPIPTLMKDLSRR